MTPAPTDVPCAKEMSILHRAVLALTAASALLPTYWPTMMESAVLYICWSRLPKINGMEKSRMRFQMLPSIIRLILAVSAAVSSF